MKWIVNKNKKTILFVILFIFFIADIKYEGLVFRRLLASVQSYLADILLDSSYTDYFVARYRFILTIYLAGLAALA
ncbi:hypothetical protein F7731_15015 [Cytobacillus depressus]|uniref:Uncharacterized protein n=1 Tax=Cytobacillus depressus TaxID=1602942 RepID=A0A6L3V5R6_9BACI|nr:hypothetical protein [Cytobacillus depressus]KAB2334517.1 hypothetical protein F7731_15015 [Cytobacillus depressus]